jgi:hypothetical protein|tara:strand:+ start:496 stop:669 length:174 start_codon:yes stop_codon:yes gene_type:complete
MTDKNIQIQNLLIQKKNLEETLEWKHNKFHEDELFEVEDTLKKLGVTTDANNIVTFG